MQRIMTRFYIRQTLQRGVAASLLGARRTGSLLQTSRTIHICVPLRGEQRRKTLLQNSLDKVYEGKFDDVELQGIKFEESGELGTIDYRIRYRVEGEEDGEVRKKPISPWFHINLSSPQPMFPTAMRFVCEMPKGTDHKMEIDVDDHDGLHPIKQDVKNGKPRFITYGLSKFNYGALPQTFEDPDAKDPLAGINGDGDPLDVVELGSSTLTRGEVVNVVPLGALGLIDEGEIDWKVLALNVKDPDAERVNNMDDFEALHPGTLKTILDWYRLYKTADGKPENSYALNERCLSVDETLEVIKHCHETWKEIAK